MFGVYKTCFFGSIISFTMRMHRTRKTKITKTNNIGIGASGVAGATAIISANFICYIVDLQYMWSKEHDRYEHEARCVRLMGWGG